MENKTKVTVTMYVIRVKKDYTGDGGRLAGTFQTHDGDTVRFISRAWFFSSQAFAEENFFSDVPCEVVPVTLTYPE